MCVRLFMHMRALVHICVRACACACAFARVRVRVRVRVRYSTHCNAIQVYC